LSGLLHNFGFLLLGHLFKNEFLQLTQAILDDPEKSVTEHEIELLGVQHTEIGAWLMQAWNMPAEIITCIREHHNEDYSDHHDTYANLVLLADRLLKSHGIGDAPCAECPAPLLQKLGLEETELKECLEKFFENEAELEAIASTLAA
jgi:HD-like signal output (HDOD) protein